jgi:ABC-type phosphate transport system permease subunit
MGKIKMNENNRDDIKLAVIQNDLSYIKEKMNAIDNKVSSGYVTKEEFDPIKKIVYGVVSLILVAVIGALVALVVNGAQ